ncbi:uncharacterized protein LOC127263812 [Andrographis paniculata]|uniref:uncharacterized protein LOC127263812 n=1 Tax=Andrographis paniculata TaxID=175694 RepID=UPI0021E7715B|nr:uncharacterized protein LOC127263812 [Andrographis paniculata]
MAVDVCSEISSPRISFSHDLNELDFVPVVESGSSLFDFDFDFCAGGRTLPQEISPADELFADGKILPVQIREIQPALTGPEPDIQTRNPEPKPKPDAANKKRLIEFLSSNFDDGDGDDREKSPAKPFWQFRRSSSDNSRANGLFRSLQFLTRSNSTGSVPTPKAAPAFPKGMQKQHSLKETTTVAAAISRRPNSSSPAAITHPYHPYSSANSSKKPSLRKSSSSRSYGSGAGVRINPVLNIPPSYIAKGTVSLFGFGSFFCSKKSKKKRK